MKKYIVGGYCRDRILGIRAKDKDYVLVGAKPRDIEYLKSIGYKQVGADFPVFLSPEGDEYALARVERKTGDGYGGFEVNTAGVTLEQDLSRRDLTMNAIAWDPTLMKHIDPFNGKKDIADKVLRHVSDAFGEDPLRVLRLARFAARYSNFKVHPSTDALVRKMVASGELNTLTKERVYVEFEKAFSEEKPSIFLKYLKDIGALKILLPHFEASKKDLEFIDALRANSTVGYADEFIWAVILKDTQVSKDYVIGSVKLPARMVKFASFIARHNENVRFFRKKSVEEMVRVLNEMNIKNNGGEEFLYKITEYFVIRREVDLDLEDLIFKVYDRYTDAPVGDVQEMVKSGSLKADQIKVHLDTTRIEFIKKMF